MSEELTTKCAWCGGRLSSQRWALVAYMGNDRRVHSVCKPLAESYIKEHFCAQCHSMKIRWCQLAGCPQHKQLFN